MPLARMASLKIVPAVQEGPGLYQAEIDLCTGGE
jgi:hypothetical protein